MGSNWHWIGRTVTMLSTQVNLAGRGVEKGGGERGVEKGGGERGVEKGGGERGVVTS
jgi:hypothetical protein